MIEEKIRLMYAGVNLLTRALNGFNSFDKDDFKVMTKEEMVYMVTMREYHNAFKNHLIGVESWLVCKGIPIPNTHDLMELWGQFISTGRVSREITNVEALKIFDDPGSILAPHRIMLVHRFEFTNAILNDISITELYTEDLDFINIFSDLTMDIAKLYREIQIS